MKTSTWKLCTVGDVVELQRGYDLPEYERQPGTVPVIGSFGITGYHNTPRATGPGVTVGRSGASFGVATYSPVDYWPHNAVLFVTDFKGNFPRFVYYLLKTIDFQSLNSGSAQPSLNRNYVYPVRTRIPSRKTQRKIAGVLSAYDDLIENNTRRIAILEEMAQGIYREWFVNFRFPGHDKVKLINSPLGKIPEGWKVLPLFDVSQVKYGKNLPTKNLSPDAPYPVYGAAKIIGRHTEFTRQERTLICGCRGSVGEMQITEPMCFVTNNSFTFDPLEKESFFWIYHYLKERGLRDVVGGAAQPQITLEGISAIQCVTPPLAVRSAFSAQVSSSFELIWNLKRKNSNLRATRDLLLPKLIGGQLDVEELDIETGGPLVEAEAE